MVPRPGRTSLTQVNGPTGQRGMSGILLEWMFERLCGEAGHYPKWPGAV